MPVFDLNDLEYEQSYDAYIQYLCDCDLSINDINMLYECEVIGQEL